MPERVFNARPAQERFCRQAELEFGQLVPGGETVVRRAVESLALTDAEIAPVIDPRVAARRVAEVDAASRARPGGGSSRA